MLAPAQVTHGAVPDRLMLDRHKTSRTAPAAQCVPQLLGMLGACIAVSQYSSCHQCDAC